MSEFLAFIATWAMSIVFQVTCLPNVLIEISFLSIGDSFNSLHAFGLI